MILMKIFPNILLGTFEQNAPKCLANFETYLANTKVMDRGREGVTLFVYTHRPTWTFRRWPWTLWSSLSANAHNGLGWPWTTCSLSLLSSSSGWLLDGVMLSLISKFCQLFITLFVVVGGGAVVSSM